MKSSMKSSLMEPSMEPSIMELSTELGGTTHKQQQDEEDSDATVGVSEGEENSCSPSLLHCQNDSVVGNR